MRSGAVHLRDLAAPDRRFEFQKRRQFFIRTHNEALTVATMRVGNPRLFIDYVQSPGSIQEGRFQLRC
jgi:hypothetical protein